MAATSNILVPFDFGPEAEAAFTYAIAIAPIFDAEVHILNIMEEESPLLKRILTDQQREQMRRGAKEHLQDFIKKQADLKGIPVTPHISKGKVYKVIVKTAKKINSRLIVMGRTDSSDMVKNFTGTNTMHIVRESEIPVITVKRVAGSSDCRHILLPLDLTKQTLQKVSRVIKLAEKINARITIASILSVDSISMEIKFSTRLHEIREIFNSFGIHCEYRVIKDVNKKIYELLNDFAKEIEANLMVIMTQQELNFTEFFIGSTAQELINRSDIPVLSLIPVSDGIEIMPDEFSKALIDPINILKH